MVTKVNHISFEGEPRSEGSPSENVLGTVDGELGSTAKPDVDAKPKSLLTWWGTIVVFSLGLLGSIWDAGWSAGAVYVGGMALGFSALALIIYVDGRDRRYLEVHSNGEFGMQVTMHAPDRSDPGQEEKNSASTLRVDSVSVVAQEDGQPFAGERAAERRTTEILNIPKADTENRALLPPRW